MPVFASLARSALASSVLCLSLLPAHVIPAFLTRGQVTPPPSHLPSSPPSPARSPSSTPAPVAGPSLAAQASVGRKKKPSAKVSMTPRRVTRSMAKAAAVAAQEVEAAETEAPAEVEAVEAPAPVAIPVALPVALPVATPSPAPVDIPDVIPDAPPSPALVAILDALVSLTPVPAPGHHPLTKTRGVFSRAPRAPRPFLRERLAAASGKVVARSVAVMNSSVAVMNSSVAFVNSAFAFISKVALAGLAVVKKTAAVTIALVTWLCEWYVFFETLSIIMLGIAELLVVSAPLFLFNVLVIVDRKYPFWARLKYKNWLVWYLYGANHCQRAYDEHQAKLRLAAAKEAERVRWAAIEAKESRRQHKEWFERYAPRPMKRRRDLPVKDRLWR